MPSFGFKLPIFIFAAVSTLAQTAPGPPAPPKHMPANANPAFDFAAIEHGDSWTKQWKFAVVSIRKNNSDGPRHIGVATADGYQMKNLFLGYLIRIAYVPQTGEQSSRRLFVCYRRPG